MASERLKASVPLLVTAPLPSAPLVPPLPICSVVALSMVVAPLWLVPVTTVVPAPLNVRWPLPVKAPEKTSECPPLSMEPPLAPTEIARELVRSAVVSSVPPSRVSALPAAPSALSAAMLSVPCLTIHGVAAVVVLTKAQVLIPVLVKFWKPWNCAESPTVETSKLPSVLPPSVSVSPPSVLPLVLTTLPMKVPPDRITSSLPPPDSDTALARVTPSPCSPPLMTPLLAMVELPVETTPAPPAPAAPGKESPGPKSPLPTAPPAPPLPPANCPLLLKVKPAPATAAAPAPPAPPDPPYFEASLPPRPPSPPRPPLTVVALIRVKPVPVMPVTPAPRTPCSTVHSTVCSRSAGGAVAQCPTSGTRQGQVAAASVDRLPGNQGRASVGDRRGPGKGRQGLDGVRLSGALTSMVPLPSALASVIAWRSEPAPLSLLFTTM